MLYAPLACRSRYSKSNAVTVSPTTATETRVQTDVYPGSAKVLAENGGRTPSVLRTDAIDESCGRRRVGGETAVEEVAGAARSSWGSETEYLLRHLQRHQRNIRLPIAVSCDHHGGEPMYDGGNTITSSPYRRFIVSATELKTAAAATTVDGRGGDTSQIGSLDAMREFLSSRLLDKFAKKHANDPRVLLDLNAEQTVCIATFYLLLLARERVRHSFFTRGRCHALDDIAYHRTAATAANDVVEDEDESPSSDEGDDCPIHSVSGAVKINDDDDDDDVAGGVDDECHNIFGRLTRRFDRLLSPLRDTYPEMYIQSYNTNNLADGLAVYVNARLDAKERLRHDLAYALSVALTSLYILARCDSEIVLFFVRYITAIRFPGQFLKSVLLLQGTSDSGKSEFVSEVLRQVFSSSLTGTLSNATLRQGVRDEINTDLMSMMNSHVCQCDEPERLNSELFKLLVSRTQLKGRRFHEQQPQYLTNLAKIIFTANDHISMRSDAGVITRLKFCVRMIHRFKMLYTDRHDTGMDFTNAYASPSVSHQFATRCFAQGVSFSAFRLGVMLIMEHYGLNMCEYNDASYVLADTISTRLAENFYRDGSQAIAHIAEINMFRAASLCGVLSQVADKVANGHFDHAHVRRRHQAPGGSDAGDGGDYYSATDTEMSSVETATEGEEDEDDDRDVDAMYDNKTTVFSTYAVEQLLNPIEINCLPDAIVKDSHNLHTLIDPYQLLLRTYDIERDVSINMTEIALTTFLRNFIDESGSPVARNNIRDVVSKMKERIKMDYPMAFHSSSGIFNLIFRERKLCR